jgi:hypothetical protein
MRNKEKERKKAETKRKRQKQRKSWTWVAQLVQIKVLSCFLSFKTINFDFRIAKS